MQYADLGRKYMLQNMSKSVINILQNFNAGHDNNDNNYKKTNIH